MRAVKAMNSNTYGPHTKALRLKTKFFCQVTVPVVFPAARQGVAAQNEIWKQYKLLCRYFVLASVVALQQLDFNETAFVRFTCECVNNNAIRSEHTSDGYSTAMADPRPSGSGQRTARGVVQ